MRLRPTGSAHTGLGEWLLQRLSAVYMGAFVIYLVVRFAIDPINDYLVWRDWFLAGSVRIGFALFFVSTLIHSWIGMRSVFMDYLKPVWLRFVAQVATGTGLLVLTLWLIQILLPSG
ncbi:MAG: succinate dehydrogenase, hydrophobic membrane anchor protein [Gammaproteobacteria bacterium]|jgi:succinate dehydrogenase / fumarate reductase membrane anchor subunit|nr:succinate dehydrogenase, hydrophobic membrane anchor protein [Gammaproteobacteria bacterium]